MRRSAGAPLFAIAWALVVLAAACSPAAAPSSAAPSPSAAPSISPPPSTMPSAETTPSAAPAQITVYAAASLRGALEALVAAYHDVAPEVTVTVSTGASSALRVQIEQGAPADVFLSADTTNTDALVTAGLSAGEAKRIATNHLAIIVPSANPAALTKPADLARPGVKIVAAGDAVPITKYANELVGKIAALPGSPTGFAESYAANVVSREDDVKAVAAKIELGEGDAAIVYSTDARASDSVTTIEIPAEAQVTASYAGLVVGASPHLDPARGFLDWLNGSDAQAILASFGFSAPGS